MKREKEQSPIINSKTGKPMTKRGLRQWWKKPVTIKDLFRK